MNKAFYNISLLKNNKNMYSIVLKKNVFFEILGSYTPTKGFRNFELVFVNKERLLFWLALGVSCEMQVFQLLKILFNSKK